MPLYHGWPLVWRVLQLVLPGVYSLNHHFIWEPFTYKYFLRDIPFVSFLSLLMRLIYRLSLHLVYDLFHLVSMNYYVWRNAHICCRYAHLKVSILDEVIKVLYSSTHLALYANRKTCSMKDTMGKSSALGNSLLLLALLVCQLLICGYLLDLTS